MVAGFDESGRKTKGNYENARRQTLQQRRGLGTSTALTVHGSSTCITANTKSHTYSSMHKKPEATPECPGRNAVPLIQLSRHSPQVVANP